MLLTISLLCCGRDKSTEKCLKSVRQIADRIGDSEIIVVDTGCDDAMKKLLSTYADKVIPFTWCNDFSAARNVGVDAASGEWFMYIDDDEWFIDPSPIVDFFKKGTYKAYTCATYRVRNYENLEGTSYGDSINSRIVKLGDKTVTRFKGRIHENITSLSGQEYHIDCHAEHYGYAFSSPEEKMAHSLRNIPLIEQMMGEEPDVIRWPQQLTAEYFGLKEYQKTIDLCNKSIKRFNSRNDREANTIRPLFYCAKILSQIFMHNLNDAQISYNEAISDTRNTNMANSRLMNLGIRIAWEKDCNHEFVIKTANDYLAQFDKCDIKTEENNNPVLLINEAYDATHLDEVLIYGMLAAIRANNADLAVSFFNRIIWTLPDNKVTISEAILNVFEELSNADHNMLYAQICTALLEMPNTSYACMNRLQQLFEADKTSITKLWLYFPEHIQLQLIQVYAKIVKDSE